MNTQRLPWPQIGVVLIGLSLVVFAVGTIVYQLRWHDRDKPGASNQSLELDASDGERQVLVYDGGFLDQASARSLESLARDSNMIIIGTVLDQELVSRPHPFTMEVPCDNPLPPELAGKQCGGTISGTVGYYLTNYTVQVDQYIKGDGGNDAQLIVQEEGGIVDGVQMVANGIPWYEGGKRYLMFLKRDPQKPGVIYTAAANLGAYPLQDGQVQRFPEARQYIGGAPALLDGLSEEEAISRIQQIVDSQQAGAP